MKTASIAAALIIASSSTLTLANGNSDNARAMATTIKNGGDNIANIAPSVSGKNAAAKGDSGWGNAGSRVTSGGTGQVSKSGKND